MKPEDYKPDMIRAIRKKREWNQQHLADACGRTRMMIYRAEKGKCSFDLLKCIANALNVNFIDLLNHEVHKL